jgi:cob(I)alamin adenosyltransferase
MKIYTKTGDSGDTGLFGGGRVGKDHPRVEAYGDVDELNATLGLVRALEPMPRIDEVIVPIQRDLFAIGALLATPDREKMRASLEKARIDDARIRELELAIDQCESELEPLRSFIVPGGTAKAASLPRRPHRLPPRGATCGGAPAHGRTAAHRRRVPEPRVRPVVHAGACRQSSCRCW